MHYELLFFDGKYGLKVKPVPGFTERPKFYVGSEDRNAKAA
jgi:hypothetical protein